MYFLEWKCSIEVALKFVPESPVNNIPALVQKMAWHWSGDKPLSEPVMVSLLTQQKFHIKMKTQLVIWKKTTYAHIMPFRSQKMKLISFWRISATMHVTGIDSKIVKATRHTILQPIVHICNLSLANGIFPQQLKIAKVIPLCKGSDASLFSIYRPISVLPVFSKVLEGVMYIRLIGYLNTNKILYSFQFGFRKNHSAAMALILLVDKIAKALEYGDFVIGLFLDFSKAFDTIDYHILLAKLYHYGIRGCLLDWFKSYLTDRKQYVYYNGYSSSRQTVTCGVPQGSIRGPLLFLIYVNDQATVSEHIFSMLFADDANMFMCGKNVQLLEEKFNAEMGKVFEWIQIDKLSLNIKKTQFMFFHGRRYVDYVPNILINDWPVSKTDCVKFLQSGRSPNVVALFLLQTLVAI